jgi:hypothetical protein
MAGVGRFFVGQAPLWKQPVFVDLLLNPYRSARHRACTASRGAAHAPPRAPLLIHRLARHVDLPLRGANRPLGSW